jgi:DNA-binding CsgD family transcriptional regulator
MRDSDDGPFAAEDVALLDDLAPILAAVARRSAAAMAGGLSAPPPTSGVLVLDGELAVRASTPGARAWLETLVPADIPHADAAALAPVYNVASRVLARRGGYAPAGPAAVRVRAASGAWALIEAQELEGAAEDTVAVTIRPAAPHEILDLRFMAHDLTRRERELVALLLEGHDTRAVTERLYLSPYTVQDHLKSVFAKVGVRTRKELVATLASIQS